MAILLEVAVALGLIYAATRVVLKVLADRKELALLREERQGRLEAAKKAEDVARELLLDKELGLQVFEHLKRELEKDGDDPS